MTCSRWRGGKRYHSPLATCWCLRQNSSLQNITVSNTLTINHSLSIELTREQPGYSFNQPYPLGKCSPEVSPACLAVPHRCGGVLSAVWAAWFRRSWLLFSALQGGFSCRPPCRQTTGRSPHLMEQSSPRPRTGPTFGRPASLTQLESPTVKTSPRCLRWMVSLFYPVFLDDCGLTVSVSCLCKRNRSIVLNLCYDVFVCLLV